MAGCRTMKDLAGRSKRGSNRKKPKDQDGFRLKQVGAPGGKGLWQGCCVDTLSSRE